jgi:hypothetical protein
VSLDYPYYEELCRLNHRAAWWWLVGDRLYYLDLLPAMLAVPGAGVVVVAGLFGAGWRWLLSGVAVFVVGVVVFFVGGSFKGQAYAIAERDGISSAEVYARGAVWGSPGSAPGDAPDTGRG